ncbi:MAG: ABC transporter substrate-binding protein [Nocardia sp.]|nr:ABC transporter substrate-binding protein [Nocardia sp.]
MKPQRIAAALTAVALLVAGCSGRGDAQEETAPGGVASGDFGTLSSVCQDGSASGATAQGVTGDTVEIGVFSDVGFTKQTELVDAAKVFTSWCNAAGGINGRNVVFEVRDAKLLEVRQRMLEACREDFALVGGGAALDGLGVKDRLSCLLPEFPAQISQPQNLESDLQVSGLISTYAHYEPYHAFRSWLINDAHPQSAGAVGIINGDSPVTKVLGEKAVESMTAAGAKVVYNELYPATGVADWTPYAQAIKSKGVKGLVFYGDFRQAAKLEDALTNMDYRLDWIDPTNNSYNPEFLGLASRSLATQNNYVELSASVPAQLSESSPAMTQLHDMYERYAPDGEILLGSVRAISSWMLFAKAAASCGDQLTRACVYQAARSEKAWEAGGLHVPRDLSLAEATPQCFNAMKATPDGWKPADFAPDQGLFRCDVAPHRYTGDYGRAMTLADVGKSMSDVE